MELANVQLDAFRQMSIVGMNRAAKALSQLMKKEIRLKVPHVATMDVASIPEMLGGREEMIVGVYIRILGDAQGSILMIISRDNATSMLELLLGGNPAGGALLTELEISTLKEVGNILASAYLNALGERFSKTFIPSVPVFTLDSAGNVVDYLMNMEEKVHEALMIDTEFSEQDKNFAGHFFMLPVLSSFTPLLEGMEEQPS
jgi:chemotaxis protein CheC